MNLNLFKNLPYKILAFLLAVSFWFFLVLFQNIIYDLGEPLEIQVINNPLDLQVASPLPEVLVRVTAPKDETAFLSAEDFLVEMDLEGLQAGEYIVPITVGTERKNVNVISYVPREVSVILEAFETKSFAVRADIVGGPASNYSVYEIVYRPRFVSLKAPKSLIDTIEYVGHKIELNGDETEGTKTTYDLMAFDAYGNRIEYGVEIVPQTVETELKFKKEVDSKSVPIFLQFSSDVDTSRINESIVTPSTIAISGNIEVLDAIKEIKTLPISAKDIEIILTGGHFSPKLIVPEGVTPVDGEPEITIEFK